MRVTTMLALAAVIPALGCGGAPATAHHAVAATSSGSSTGPTSTSGSPQVTTGSTGHGMAAATGASSAASSSSSSSSTSGSSANGSSSTGSGSVGGATAGSSAAGSGSGSTTSANCYGNGSFPGGGVPCCSGYTDANGFCANPPASSSTASSGSTTGTGTSTGSTTTSGGSTTGTTGASCPASCYQARGYHCENGQCVLNGGSGPIQVTLYWGTTLQAGGVRAREDLDLHLTDPSGCEIFYANRSCGSGSLDLDSNAGCGNTDNPGSFGNDTENIIYGATATPAHGTYHVYVDDYTNGCGPTDPDPFNYQVTVRFNGQSQVFSGAFHQSDADHNAHTPPGWVHITDFTY